MTRRAMTGSPPHTDHDAVDTFRVPTRHFGNNPRIKLLLHRGAGTTHGYKATQHEFAFSVRSRP